MKQLIFFLALIFSLLYAGDVLAEHIIFGGVVVDRSLVSIALEYSGGGNIQAVANLGPGGGRLMIAECEDKATDENIKKALPRIADHLNKTRHTTLIDTLSSAGLTGCKYRPIR